MPARLKKAILHASRAMGLFHLARWFTRRGLRILCYHAFAFEDESSFRARMYLRPETFENRLRFLKNAGFPVLPLGEAVALLDQGCLPSGGTVITIDDGFFSVYRLAMPILQRFRMPASVYVSTYYANRASPVFRLVVQYMFWKSRVAQIDLAGLGLAPAGTCRLSDPADMRCRMWDIIRHGESDCDEAGRVALNKALAQRLQVDYDHLVERRLFHIMRSAEITEALANGLDIQLHTHRHRFPEDESEALREIQDNRAALEPLVQRPLTHFCYPSGVFSENQFSWLRAAGIASATTCEPGLNYQATPKLALLRFLDGEDVSQIEFEAEMYGFNEILRKTRSYLRALSGSTKERVEAPSYQ
jgi:peptidoglycan/xylan/chitin deacetylase (PgdA/CDA1 family)